MYFEIYDWDTLVKRGEGKDILNEIEWEHELMAVPSLNLTLPIEYSDYIKGREEFKLWVNDKCFWGIIKDHTLNKADETIEIRVDHVMSEWEYRQISVNNAIQDKDINAVYKGAKTVKKGNESITASDFSLSQKAFEKASNTELINYAYARAWDNTNGDPVKIVDVDSKIIESTETTETKIDIGKADAVPVSTKGQAVVEYARRFLGTPYVWGGDSLTKGCDCSGFTKGVFAHFGINIARYSQHQLNYGVPVSRNDIQPGDLMVYDGHVAIVVDKNHIIHSSTGYPGKKDGVMIRSNPFYRTVLGIRRLVGTKDDKSRTRQYSSKGYGSKILDGREVPAIFTAYYPGENGEWKDAHGKRLRASDMICAAPREVDQNSQIQIKSITPSDGGYQGKIYTVRDTGSAIIIDDQGNYHIDILVGSKSTMDKFGRRKGTIILGNGKWHYGGNTTSVTTKTKKTPTKYELTFKTDKGTSIAIEMTIADDYATESASEASVVDNIGDIFGNTNFAYPGWVIDFQDDSAGRMIDYVYSRQNKLEALTKTMELTHDLFWRVGFWNDKRVEVGKFGKKKSHIISLKPPGQNNSQILEEPTVEWDYENVVNVATVYSEKSDTGMSSMTLREVYKDKDLQIDGFPVVILRANVNNERSYWKYAEQYSKLAPNNWLEYAILDEESIRLEAGYLVEGTYAFTDLAPTNTSGKKISDAKRKKAARTAYRAAIRKLKQARRTCNTNIPAVTQIPADINVGDKVRFIYDNSIYNLDACTNYWKKILTEDDWYYVQKIGYHIMGGEVEINDIVLTKYLKIQREGDNQ